MLSLQAEAAQELLARRRASTTVAGLYSFLFPHFSLAPFQRRIGEGFDGFVDGSIPRLIVNLPPRHTKSWFGSLTAPASYIGKQPAGQILSASFASDLSRDFGREVRNVLLGPDFAAAFPKVRLRKDSKAAGRWHTNYGGVYYAASVKKSMLGRGANRAIIDDPHKDFQDGNNHRSTDQVWNWFRQNLMTRLMKGACIALIMQRMSDHDLTARILAMAAEKGEHWEQIVLPAIADAQGKPIHYDGTPAGLEALRNGHALWADQFSLEVLVDLAATMGPSEFNAMYQQIPDQLTGAIIKEAWMRHWGDRDHPAPGRMQLPKDYDLVAQHWDMRFTDKERGSWVVGQVWGYKDDDSFMLDQVRGQWGFEDTCSAVVALSSRYPAARKKVIEKKANGEAVENHLKKRISGIELWEVKGGDKVARLRATEGEWSSGHVHLPPPEIHPWVTGYIQRLKQFPKEPNDEGDCTSQALNWRYKRRRQLAALATM